MRRELAIALRAPITWLVAAVSTLLVGHGFVLAVDVYSASSRSALASTLQSREMDPLSGIVRPTLGGLGLAIALLVPVIAARVLSVEKERRTWGPLALLEGSSSRVVLRKFGAALVAASFLLVAPVGLFILLGLSGAHVDAIETALAVTGEGLHIVVVTAVSIAAAAWTRTLAQSVTVGILFSVTSWAIDVADGFAALAWLGGASAWSLERQLAPFQEGVVSIGAIGWLAVAAAGALALALIGASFDATPTRRVCAGALVVGVTALLLATTGASRRGYDWTEQRRASLPPAAVDALRRLPRPLALDVFLDRDDSRRRQLESDVVAKLYLARPDLVVRTPLDDRAAVTEGEHDPEYGRIVVHAGSATRETRSTSRREIVTLIFEAAGVAFPDWVSPPYPGYPFVADGVRRALLLAFAYFVMPIGFFAVAIPITRRRYVR